jgi:nucleoside-diphosphate-sugar epimerase
MHSPPENVRRPRNALEVVEADLEHIARALHRDWPLLEGRRLLVTGGAGFLGYYFTQAATYANRHARPDERVDITVYDNFARGAPQWLLDLEEAGELRNVPHDMRTPLPASFGPFDYVIHAASIASPTYYRAHPVETMDANIVGLRNLLDHARASLATSRPVRGLLFLSSSEIYGDPDPRFVPTPESYRGNVSCTGPRACYDEAKRFGETLCTVFAHHHGVPTRIARPFNNYGPGLKINDGRVLPDFARDVLAGRDVVVLSDGTATRTFCYAADAVAGYYQVLLRGRNGEAYNIGTEAPEVSVGELAERVVSTARALFGYTGQVVYRPSGDVDYLVDNPTRRCPDLRKAREEVGYAPMISLEVGLERSLLWYRDHQEGVREPWASTTPARAGAVA